MRSPLATVPELPHLDEPVWRELSRYLRFGAEDEELLRALRPIVAPHFEAIASKFYERIREHEHAHAVFRDEAQVDRLHDSLVQWMGRVFTGPHDAAYYEETAHVGRLHVAVGLPDRYLIGAMTLIRVELQRIVASTPGLPVTASGAIDKVLDIELATMLDTYTAENFERLRRYEETLRAEVQTRQAELEAQWSSAVELSRILFVAIDGHGRIRLFNREAERTTGFARDEVVGKSFVASFVPVEHRPDVERAIAAALAGGQPLVEGSAIRTRAGRLREVRWQFASHPDATSGDSLFAIGQDTTAQSSLAARLRQSERLAAVGTLAAGLAHEIRNPLNGALLHVTFLERGLRRLAVDDADTLDAVATVRSEIERLSDLVTEFLEFARPQPLDKAWGSLNAVCERAARLVTTAEGENPVAIELDLPTTPVELAFDPARVEQILLNLLRNAVEATSPVGGTVVLRLRRQPRAAVLEVEDAGRGIEDASAPVFDPFYSTKPAGTGLGLSIVHRIASDHGGSVSFRSQPGRTVFRVELPIEVPPDSRAPAKGNDT